MEAVPYPGGGLASLLALPLLSAGVTALGTLPAMLIAASLSLLPAPLPGPGYPQSALIFRML